jgi:predicted nucleic acid-binding protein
VIFVDTSAFIARYLARNQFHNTASDYWKTLASSSVACVTSNFVVDEVVTLLSRRTTAHFAAQRARQIYASRVLHILRPDEADKTSAVVVLEQYADREISFTDCVSFALMKRHGITEAFTFDAHFATAGFAIKP